TVYFGAGGTLYAVTNMGSNKWTFATGNPSDGSPAVAADGMIYYSSMTPSVPSSGYLYSIRPDGSLRWSYPAQSGCGSPAIGSSGIIYIGGYAYLHALSQYGTNYWKCPVPDGSASRFASAALGMDGTAYVPSYDERGLYAVSTSGTQAWNYSFPYAPGDSASIAYDGTLYFTGGGIYSLLPTGASQWTNRDGFYDASSPVIGRDGTIYIADSHSFRPLGNGFTLYAISRGGATTWQFATNLM